MYNIWFISFYRLPCSFIFFSRLFVFFENLNIRIDEGFFRASICSIIKVSSVPYNGDRSVKEDCP